MYAVIETGGKQYKVAKNDVIEVEKIAGEAGKSVTFDRVLMVAGDKAAKTGAPTVEGAVVTATVLEQMRGEKIVVFKKKRRQNYRRKAGHRQALTVLRIEDVKTAGTKAARKRVAKAKATDGRKVKSAATSDDKDGTKATPARKRAAAKPKTSGGKTEEKS